MAQKLATFLLMIAANVTFGQNWELDFLNYDDSYPFKTENDINGLFFITTADLFDFYSTPVIIHDNSRKELTKIEFTEQGTKVTFKNQAISNDDTESQLRPWLLILNPDYFRLVMECVDTTNTHFIVRLNDNDLGYIQKQNRDFKKVTHSQFVETWTVFGLDFNRIENPLRQLPKNDGKVISNSALSKYEIWTGNFVELKGDWIKIKTIENEVGWIKWREDKKVKIRMYYAC